MSSRRRGTYMVAVPCAELNDFLTPSIVCTRCHNTDTWIAFDRNARPCAFLVCVWYSIEGHSVGTRTSCACEYLRVSERDVFFFALFFLFEFSYWTHSQSRHIFEFLWTVRTLKWTFIAVDNLMLFECTLCDETFATLFTNKWTISGVDGTNVGLHIDQFTETFFAKPTRMNQFQVVGQMNGFMALQLSRCGKPFRTLWTSESVIRCGNFGCMFCAFVLIVVTFSFEKQIAVSAAVSGKWNRLDDVGWWK